MLFASKGIHIKLFISVQILNNSVVYENVIVPPGKDFIRKLEQVFGEDLANDEKFSQQKCRRDII